MGNDSIKRALEELNRGSALQQVISKYDRLQSETSLQAMAKRMAEISSPANSAAAVFAKYRDQLDTRAISLFQSIPPSASQMAAEEFNALQSTLAAAFSKLEPLDQTIAAYAKRISIPTLAATDQIANEVNSSLQSMLKAYDDRLPGIQQAMMAMQTPWIDASDAERSIRGFSELQAIGKTLKTLPAFDPDFSSLLRLALGDWRDPVTVPHDAYAEPPVRTEAYVEHGLNTELTDFPDLAFGESLAVTGIKGEPPVLISLYGNPFPEPDDKEGHARTVEAFGWLFSFETQIRKFISQVLAAEFGERWEKQQVPGHMREEWNKKKLKAQSQGQPLWPLIAYADFTDYIQLITKKDHWILFAPYFGRLEDVRESFQRLFPFRIGTMHSRIITKEDQLMLFVETTRLMNAILRRGQST